MRKCAEKVDILVWTLSQCSENEHHSSFVTDKFGVCYIRNVLTKQVIEIGVTNTVCKKLKANKSCY